MSARQALELFQVAEKLNSRIVLVGDTGQHSSVERGDAFRLLMSHGCMRVVTIDKIQRQSGQYKLAVEQMARGNAYESIKILDSMGEVTEIEDHESRFKIIAERYVEAIQKGKTVAVIAPTNFECRAVTEKIREKFKEERILQDGREWDVLRNEHFSPGDKEDWHRYERGQTIRFMRPEKGFSKDAELKVIEVEEKGVVAMDQRDRLFFVPYSLGESFNVYKPATMEVCQGDLVRITANTETVEGHTLENRDSFKVQGFSPKGEIILETGWKLPNSFVYMEHGYANTSYSAQSDTVDWVFLSHSSFSRDAADAKEFYTAISRGSERGHLFTDDLDTVLDSISYARERDLAMEAIGEKNMGPEMEETPEAEREMEPEIEPTQPEPELVDLSDFLGQAGQELNPEMVEPLQESVEHAPEPDLVDLSEILGQVGQELSRELAEPLQETIEPASEPEPSMEMSMRL